MSFLRLAILCFTLILTALSLSPVRADEAPHLFPTAEPFEGRQIILKGPYYEQQGPLGLLAPWGMIWGPNGRLWITERPNGTIVEVDPATGARTDLGRIEGMTIGAQHEGLLGLALAPDFDRSGWLYVNYTYYVDYTDRAGYMRLHQVARLKYDPQTKKLGPPETILAGIPSGDGHQGGRLLFGPDGMLYLSKGDLGHNEGDNRCKPNEAQRLPTAEEVAAKDWSAYVGKVLRMTPEGGIPDDNPVFEGVRSHIFTLGHRNPQGLVFVGDILYGVEYGPSTDDELNILVAGGNYGWPYVAGFKDDQSYAFIDWSKVDGCSKVAADVYLPDDVPQVKESAFKDPNFKEPAKTFFTVPNGYNFKDGKFKAMPFLGNPTIAPSSVDYYPADGPIKAWRNSLLISSLKNGAIYRVPLSEDGKQAQGDLIKYFHTANRYNQVLVAPDGRSIYVITDNSGSVLNEDGLPQVKIMKNPGALLVFEYRGE